MLIIFRKMGYVFGKAKFWTPQNVVNQVMNQAHFMFWDGIEYVYIYIFIIIIVSNIFSRGLPHQWSLSQFAHASHVITKNYQIERFFVCVMCFGWFSSCLMLFRHVGR